MRNWWQRAGFTCGSRSKEASQSGVHPEGPRFLLRAKGSRRKAVGSRVARERPFGFALGSHNSCRDSRLGCPAKRSAAETDLNLGLI
jgi:hypothetical protein